jgi:hypothetical protein
VVYCCCTAVLLVVYCCLGLLWHHADSSFSAKLFRVTFCAQGEEIFDVFACL